MKKNSKSNSYQGKRNEKYNKRNTSSRRKLVLLQVVLYNEVAVHAEDDHNNACTNK